MSSAFLQTRLTDLLGCRYPILQAGMGGVARADLVTAVVTHGGYGFLGMVRERPKLIADEIRRVRSSAAGRRTGGLLRGPGACPVLLLGGPTGPDSAGAGRGLPGPVSSRFGRGGGHRR